MTQSLTEWLQESRFIVVAVDHASGRVRVRTSSDACSDLSCQAGTLVVADDHTGTDLGALNPGDVIKVESAGGRPEKIVVVRRVWEELASPEI